MMGYVNETEMAEWFGPEDGQYLIGTWTDDQAGNVWRKRRAASAGTSTIKLSLKLPANSTWRRGCLLKKVVVHLRHLTASPTSLNFELLRLDLPAVTGGAPAAVSEPFTYDDEHDTPAKRITVAEHRVELTLNEAAWVQPHQPFQVVMTLEASASSIFFLYGAQAFYTLRL